HFCASQYFCCIAPKTVLYASYGSSVRWALKSRRGPSYRGRWLAKQRRKKPSSLDDDKPRMMIMAENPTPTAAPKTKAKPVAVRETLAERPMFEVRKSERRRVEPRAEFREGGERGVGEAKENYEKMRRAAEPAAVVFEDTQSNASRGAAHFGLKVIE